MRKQIWIFISILLLVLAILPISACAEGVAITAREGILVSEDGQVLQEHNALEKRPIASMTKIMTLLCIYDSIDNGKISLDDTVVVSSRAAGMGGSQVFLEANGAYKVNELVKSIIVCSANDSCVAMAEHVSGSVESFVEMMNSKCREYGLVATHFENCTGLPAVSQFSCAKDVAQMFLQLIKHPHYFSCANIWMEDFVHPSGRVTGMTNTNKLVRFYQGCDGGKTGYTCEAQHCLAATAKRGDTRVVAVIIGAKDSKTRFKEVSDMFNYAFANYQSNVLMSVSDSQKVAVDGGKQKSVEVAPAEKLVAFGKKGDCDYTLQVDLPQTIQAPILKGDVVGQAHSVDKNGVIVKSVDLVAQCDVQAKTYWDYVKEIVVNK
ncbi:MAG: D-alanyl-D-alanine carboxypeptidase [Clostridia bacterium]|nr:D-alanyl-D-alanine carboxypeptidase [Clostridia bacterium]